MAANSCSDRPRLPPVPPWSLALGHWLLLVRSRPDGHLCTNPEEKCPVGDTHLMAIYGACWPSSCAAALSIALERACNPSNSSSLQPLVSSLIPVPANDLPRLSPFPQTARIPGFPAITPQDLERRASAARRARDSPLFGRRRRGRHDSRLQRAA
jgi:hypothetical protein